VVQLQVLARCGRVGAADGSARLIGPSASLRVYSGRRPFSGKATFQAESARGPIDHLEVSGGMGCYRQQSVNMATRRELFPTTPFLDSVPFPMTPTAYPSGNELNHLLHNVRMNYKCFEDRVELWKVRMHFTGEAFEAEGCCLRFVNAGVHAAMR
jgi:hypothetical protein